MPDFAGTKVAITEDITNISVSNTNGITVTLAEETTNVKVNNYAVPANYQAAENSVFVPYGSITATNVQDALRQLADQNFRGASAPSGSTIEGTSTLAEGDTWYDTDDDQFKVYRETSTGTFQWVPIIVGAAADDSDTIDAGSY
jgi:hypothetical protein